MTKAPSFSLFDQDGTMRTLDDYTGNWVVLYFYPKDETKGCTDEACSFRDGRDMLQERGVSVVGISPDSVESHKSFASNHNLNFTLLSDTGLTVAKAYGVLSDEGRMRRMSFLLSPEGNIYKEYPNVDPSTHIGEIFKDLEKI
jgi:peroxiredoxin Q/BCP